MFKAVVKDQQTDRLTNRPTNITAFRSWVILIHQLFTYFVFKSVRKKCLNEFDQYAYRPIDQLTNLKWLQICLNTSLNDNSVLNLVISYWIYLKICKKMTLKLDDTDRRTDGPTDQPTDIASYRVASTRLKTCFDILEAQQNWTKLGKVSILRWVR